MNNNEPDYIDIPLERLTAEYGDLNSALSVLGRRGVDQKTTFRYNVGEMTEEDLLDCGMNREQLMNYFNQFIARIDTIKRQDASTVESLVILGGQDKQGNAENQRVEVRPGQAVCIVGPTGSGKSRLLEDIEFLAQRDTPTKRAILINGKAPAATVRFSGGSRLVAQLSQNMNFIMDLSVRKFVNLHAESRMIGSPETAAEEVIRRANELAGEPFSPECSLTQLSGGQSRALMIADTAVISSSPVVLIDEIENAGVDRRKALDLLIRKDKIIFLSTHDPLLALSGDMRLVIGNGAIQKIIIPGDDEKENLKTLARLDEKLLALRNRIRRGEEIKEHLYEALLPENIAD